jgi:regulation of enolase protein 1 (concanavalin A-like superfamily)
MKIEFDKLFWIHEPKDYTVQGDKIIIKTESNTDFWQRTYYGFRNDSAPALLLKTVDPYFSFIVKTEFDSKHRFDQCGVIIYQNSDNWFKASIEFENEEYQRLGSVVTNNGYSDWATTDVSADIKTMFYRLSRRENDFCIEISYDGLVYKQMRIFHLFEGGGEIQFGIYACSPEISSFEAVFSELEKTECKWEAHS